MDGKLVFGGATIPYTELLERAHRAAQGFATAGIGEGGTVAVMLKNHPVFVEAMLAARRLGAYWCPVNWHFKAEETGYILRDCGAGIFVVGDDLVDAVRGGVPPGVQVILLSQWDAWRDSHAPFAGPQGRFGQSMAYTSGTTGRPKGVKRTLPADAQAQAELSAAVWREVYGLQPGARALLSAPLYHSAPNAYALRSTISDAALWLEPKFDPERTLQLIHDERLTHAYLVPTMFSRLLKLPDAVKRRYDVGSMRFVISMGSPCAPEVKRGMIDWWGPVIHESYAASELGIVSFITAPDALRKPGSAGKAVGGTRIRIFDALGNALPPGETGLIYARPPATPDFTYVNNDDARRGLEREGLWTLGDMGYLDEEGYLFICDRAVDMVISGGVNIYPAEIEAALVTMPGIVDCAVFGIPDAEFGEALAAAVQLEPGATADARSVQAWLRDRIADYKVPRTVAFHVQLPREESGKIFKRRLKAPYWEQAGRSI